MKNSIILIIFLTMFAFIGLNNLGNILPIGIDKALKNPNRTDRKAKRIKSQSSAFRSQSAFGGCKISNGQVAVDSRRAVVMDMPLPGQPNINYRYTTRFSSYSPDRSRLLAWQDDGNLVVYDTASGRSVWASNTSRRGETLAFQSDNNIVIYDNRGVGVWDSGTIYYCGHNGASTPNYGATLNIEDASAGGRLILIGQVDNIYMGSSGTSGAHFIQDFHQ